MYRVRALRSLAAAASGSGGRHTTLSAAAAGVTVAKRRVHVAAVGAFEELGTKEAIDQLPKERAMVSTQYTRKEVEKHNPGFPQILRNLRAAGHRVAFGVDVTRLHDDSHAPAVKMMQAAARHRIDMKSMRIAFLRSLDEHGDQAPLLSATVGSADRAGVRQLTVMHSLKRNAAARQAAGAPHEEDWEAAARRFGYVRTRFYTDPSARRVESVLRKGRIDKGSVPAGQTGVSTFEK